MNEIEPTERSADAQSSPENTAPTTPSLGVSERLLLKSKGVGNLGSARGWLRDAAHELDAAGETQAHRHVMALLASVDDCLEDLAVGNQS